jgi:hypothetical protein
VIPLRRRGRASSWIGAISHTADATGRTKDLADAEEIEKLGRR